MMYFLSSLFSLISDTDPVLVLWVISSLCPEPSSASLHLLLRLTSQISAQHSHSVRQSPKSHSRSGSSCYCLHTCCTGHNFYVATDFCDDVLCVSSWTQVAQHRNCACHCFMPLPSKVPNMSEVLRV